jgi:hypothetical protein
VNVQPAMPVGVSSQLKFCPPICQTPEVGGGENVKV